ncbi:hypothetical protein ACJMK2_039644 [Sinanodonta woodiana]|uniref:Parvovirus non-structural protein 1 helicase domain-containing protein n=1 Tax=Sinanodonta woodiana TaxID=1069815 RepID=A0ABD3WGL8_SINWO
MTDKDILRTRNVLNAICKYMRKLQHGYLVFHDLHGTKCSFTAETHYHFVGELKHKEGKIRSQDNGIWQNNFFQELRGVVKGNMFDCKSEKILYMENMTGYLKQPPRQLIGTTSIAMDRHYTETSVKETVGKKSPARGTKRRIEGEEYEEPEAPKRQRVGNDKRQRRPGDRLKTLMDLMRKYKRNDIHKMLKEAIRKDEDEDYDTLLDFLAVPSNRIVAQNAAKLLCSSEPQEINEHLDVNKLLSVEQSRELFKARAKEKRGCVKSGTYWLLCLFATMFRKVPKRNTFLCVGAASSGMTFWTDPVLCLQQYVGLSANDSHFCFAELAHSKVGLINELKFNRDTLEIYKQIGEGKDCMVPVKNQGLGSCDAQPIIVTAMEERSFYFHFNSKSKVLAEHKSKNTNKGINPYWLKGVFSVLIEAIEGVNVPDLIEKRDFNDPIWRKLDELLCMDETKDGIYGEVDSESSDDEW